MNVIVDGGAVPALMTHLQAPPPCSDGDMAQKPFEHEVEKGSAFALGLLAIKVLNLILMCCLYGVLVFHAPSIVFCDLVVGIDCFYSQSIRS